MTKHYLMGGSNAEITLNCPGSLYLREKHRKAPHKYKNMIYANTGSLCHRALEVYLRDSLSPESLIGNLRFEDLILTKELVDKRVNPAIAMLHEALNKYEIRTKIIERTYEHPTNSKRGGTCDVIGFSADETTMLVLDYKFGRIPVDVTSNAQLLFYAALAIKSSVKKVILAIVQPLAFSNLKIYETNYKEVAEFDAKMDIAAANTLVQSQKYIKMGTWCKYCPVIDFCPRQNKKNSEINDKLKKILAKGKLMI